MAWNRYRALLSPTTAIIESFPILEVTRAESLRDLSGLYITQASARENDILLMLSYLWTDKFLSGTTPKSKLQSRLLDDSQSLHLVELM